MMKMIKTLFIKYKEIITYIIFGVLTTLVNFFAFWLFTKIFGEDLYLMNNAIAWVVGVVFAYITNKFFVFESKSWDLKLITKEITGFLGARIFSFLVEEGGMFLFISVLGLGEKSLELLGFTITGQFIVKILLAVIVVVLNYVFSKFFIFRNQGAGTSNQKSE
ncbi:MAG: GtrA family protein [Clostridia bacterium]|nr:GtrA family protein [Clostridia bacterium]